MPADWLDALWAEAGEEARRRGDSTLGTEHLALALTRPGGRAGPLLRQLGVDPLHWRDSINDLLGANEGAAAEREGRHRKNLAGSPAALRFGGELVTGPGAAEVGRLAREEAAANSGTVGPAELLIGLLREVGGVGAGTGRWHGLTPGRVRRAAGLRHERRVVAGGAAAPPGPGPPPAAAGPLVLHGGGGVAPDLLRQVVARAPRRPGSGGPTVVLVDLAWFTRRPRPEDRRHHLEAWEAAGAARADDAGLTDREDAWSPEACERLAGADLIWFPGGSAASTYDRLWATPALDAVRHASDGGAVVGGSSAGAVVWGAGALSDFASEDEPEPFPYLGWLPDLVVFGHYADSREAAFRDLVRAFPGCRGLAVAHQGAVLVEPGWDQMVEVAPGLAGQAHFLVDALDAPLVPLGRG